MACKTCVKLDIWRCLAIGLPPDIIHLNGSVHYFNHPAKGGTPISGKPYIINQSNISESSRKVGFPPSCSMSSGSCWAWVACKESWRVNGASVLLMLRVKNITIVYPTKSYIIVQVIWCIHIYIYIRLKRCMLGCQNSNYETDLFGLRGTRCNLQAFLIDRSPRLQPKSWPQRDQFHW